MNQARSAIENILDYVRGKDDLFANGAIRRLAEEALEALPAAEPAGVEALECARWNFDADDTSLLVCRNDHEKGENCAYAPMHPAEVLALVNSLRSEVLELRHRLASPPPAQNEDAATDELIRVLWEEIGSYSWQCAKTGELTGSKSLLDAVNAIRAAMKGEGHE